MKKLHWLSLALLPILTWAIWSNTNEDLADGTAVSSDLVLLQDTLAPPITLEAKQLLQTTCYPCHNPKSASHDEMLAPPLVGIKRRYSREYPNRASFVEHVSAFVEAPSEATALMKGPVRRFGLMPKTAPNKEQIKAVVEYIYDHELEMPAWFPKHYEEKHGQGRQHGH